MDLRPINPYYKQPQRMARVRRKAVSGYSYPYTWEPPVTDRTQADVNYAKELIVIGWNNMTAEQRSEYLAGLKGCLNTSDLSRIENNIQMYWKWIKPAMLGRSRSFRQQTIFPI